MIRTTKLIVLAFALAACGGKPAPVAAPQPAPAPAAGAISPATTAAIEAWFAQRATGAPPLPDKLTDLEGKPIGKAEFAKQFLGKDSTLFKRDPWETLELVEKRGTTEVVRVGTGLPDPSTCKTGGEDCEGFESITFVVTDGAITAIEVFAAG